MLRCGACGSGHTGTMGAEVCCLECGAFTSPTGEVVRPAKTPGEKGGPDGEPVDGLTVAKGTKK